MQLVGFQRRLVPGGTPGKGLCSARPRPGPKNPSEVHYERTDVTHGRPALDLTSSKALADSLNETGGGHRGMSCQFSSNLCADGLGCRWLGWELGPIPCGPWASMDPSRPFFNTLVRMMTTRCMQQAKYFASGAF